MPQHALTPPSFSLSLTRKILNQTYDDFMHGRRHPVSQSHQPDDLFADHALMDFPDDVEYAAPVVEVIGTSADQLGSAIIAKDQADGIDPYTIDEDGISRMQTRKMPLTEMIYAARFAALLTCPDKVAALATPQAITALCLPSPEEREVFKDVFPDIFEQTAKALVCDGVDLEGTAIVSLPYVTSRSSTDPKVEFGKSVERTVAKGDRIIAIASAASDLPPSGKAFCSASYDLPPINADMVIEILRQTHSATGQLSDAFVRKCLPTNENLQRLTMPLLQGAFHEESTIKVALRLTALPNFADVPVRSDTLCIEDMYLPASVKADMEQLVDDLAQWRDGGLDWSEVTSSILLYGPPGTGKTLLAKSLAGTADIPLIMASYGDCQRAGHQGDFLRVLAEKVEKAVSTAPSIFFLDELDSFFSRAQSSRSSGYVVAIVNALLEHLTLLNETPGVIVVGATNFVANVDPAILRPGRFDLHIALAVPDKAGIQRLFELDLGAAARHLDLQCAVDRMIGQSGAQVAALLRDARGKARRAKASINDTHLTAALDRIVPEVDPADLYRVAIHEAGHAVVAHALGCPLPEIVRVTPRGGEYVSRKPFAATKQTVDNQIIAVLVGRAAEACIIGNVSDGAANDLEQATELAYRARYSWGLYGNNLLAWNDQMMAALDPLSPLGSVVNTDLKNHYARSKEIAQVHADSIKIIADALLEKREMDGSAMTKLLELRKDTIAGTVLKCRPNDVISCA